MKRWSNQQLHPQSSFSYLLLDYFQRSITGVSAILGLLSSFLVSPTSTPFGSGFRSGLQYISSRLLRTSLSSFSDP
jgi:hypothetical protein